MKLILPVLFAAFFFEASAQNMQFTVAAGDKSLVAAAEEDNANKLFEIDSKTIGVDLLTISVEDEEIEKDWKRSFIVYDSSDKAITEFPEMHNGTYSIKVSGLKEMLSPDEKYFIYTTAMPEDPQKAMLVKVARILVCVIKIR